MIKLGVAVNTPVVDTAHGAILRQQLYVTLSVARVSEDAVQLENVRALQLDIQRHALVQTASNSRVALLHNTHNPALLRSPRVSPSIDRVALLHNTYSATWLMSTCKP